MSRVETPSAPDLPSQPARKAVRLEQATIAYNVAEGVVAVTAGFIAGSISLVGFGFDSWIEVATAAVVLQRLRAGIRSGSVDETKVRRELRFVAVTFFVLAAYVTIEGVRDVLARATPDVSPVGIALTGLSILVMPLLARAKRRAGEQLRSQLVIADAAETKLCAWLSVSTFAGLVAYSLVGWTWIDPVAGFAIAVFAVAQGREAWEGELVCEDASG
ncbi:MAG: cation diffusion facilitator family transporter [Actinomycetota bacterium]